MADKPSAEGAISMAPREPREKSKQLIEKLTGKSGLDLRELKMSIIEAAQKDIAHSVVFESVIEKKDSFEMTLLLKKLKSSFGNEAGSRKRLTVEFNSVAAAYVYRQLLITAKSL